MAALQMAERVYTERFGWKFLGERRGFARNYSEQQWLQMLDDEYEGGCHEGSPDGIWKVVNHLGLPALVRRGGPGKSLGTFKISHIRF